MIAIPGPSAAVAALSASGLPSDEFLFVGFLPAKTTARSEIIGICERSRARWSSMKRRIGFDEMLADVLKVFGDREVCVAREMTKIHEESVFGQTVGCQRSGEADWGICESWLPGSDQAAPSAAPLNLEGLSRKDANQLYEVFFRQDRGYRGRNCPISCSKTRAVFRRVLAGPRRP